MIRKGLPIILLFFLCSPVAYGAENTSAGTPARKLQRGIANVFLSPIELAEQISTEEKHSKLEPTWLFGGIRGVYYGAGRILIGVYEILTFPIPVPSNYGPLLEPEFLTEYWDRPEPE